MNKNFAKRMVAAAILTSWLASPGFVWANTPLNGGILYNDIVDTIENGSYINGEAVYNGGAIYNTASGQLTINGAIFDSNKGGANTLNDAFGGAIFNAAGGEITLNGTNETLKFINNTVGNATSYAEVTGGAISNEGKLTINTIASDSSNAAARYAGALFENNRAIGIANNGGNYLQNGGAIFNKGDKLVIGDGTTFRGNEASRGAAIYNLSTAGDVKIGHNVTFENNHGAQGPGGAVHTKVGFTAGDNLLVQNNTTGSGSYGGAGFYLDLTGAEKSAVIGKNALFYKNSTDLNRTGSRGGALLMESGTATFGDGAQFVENQAQAGGAIYNQASKIIFETSADTTGVLFKGNNASSLVGGAIHNLMGQFTFNDKVYFTKNTAAGNGGAIANQNYLTFKGTMDFNDNVYYGELDANGNVVPGSGNHSDASGGGLYNEGTMNFNGAENLFAGNSAAVQGGGIMNQGGTVTFVNKAIFVGNTAGTQGGAVSNYDGTMSFGDDSVFIGNSSQNGGAISNVSTAGHKATITIGDNALFQDNTADYAGAILSQNASLTIGHNAKFINNSNKNVNSGGAITMDSNGANDTPSFGIIGDNVLFDGNKSTKSGGGLYIYEGGGELSFELGEGAVFNNNEADLNGGAVAVYGASGTTAGGSQGLIIEKGAVFVNNHAVNGAAVYLSDFGGHDANMTIKGGSVDKTLEDGSTVVQETVFSGNIASGLGGAVYNAGSLTLDTAGGNITFKNNTAGGVLNDIHMAADSSLELSGTGSISIGGGITGDAAAGISNSGANLVLETGSINAGYLGGYTQTSGSVEVNSKFFGGTSNINGGTMNLNKGAEIVAGSSVILGNGTSIDINGSTETEKVGDVYINGAISSLAQGDGSITLSGGNLIVNSDQSGFTGKFSQNGDIDTSTTITADGTFFGGTNEINSGKLVLKDGASLKNDIEIKDYSVALDLDHRELLLSDGGINITGNNTAAGTHKIFGSLNLENTDVKVDAATGIQSDVYIASGSTLTNTDGSKNIVVGNASHNVTLSLGAGAVTDESQTLTVSDNSTINLTPNGEINGSLNLHAAITGDTDANLLVDGTELKAGEGKYSVGTVALNADNSSFLGKYNQNDGTVIVNDGSVFFGGTNNVNTVVDALTGETTSGALVLEDGALLSNNVNINGNATSEVLELASVAFNGSTGEVTQSNITSGEFNYAGTETASGTGVNVNNAGAIFANDTIITELDPTQNALVLNTNTTENKGVRFLGFGKGSGVDGDIQLGSGTGLAYMDGAYIKDGSSLVMDNADLIFVNDKTDINYNPEITGSGTITKGGMGTTTIQSALNENIDINTQSGALNLVNSSTAGLGNIGVGDVGDPDPDKTPAIVNIAATNGTLNIKDINVFGENAVLNIMGNATGGDAVVNKGTLGVFGQSSINSLSLGSTLNMLGNNTINNLNIGSDFTLTDNSKYMFDVDPRSKATDTINADTIINTNSTVGGDPYTMLISGINFTQSPIDRNVQFDITNMISENGDSRVDLIRMPDGGVVANSQMGKYLITSSGASNMLNANLIHLNPQMYRGQVATVASYANQLVVNNILFDHMNILANDLIARDKNANRYAAANPLFAPYQYSKKDGDLWFKGYGNFERISMTQGLNVGNNAYGSIIGADFPLITYKNGWNLVPTAYIAYNGGHQTFDGVSMYQNGAQVGAMATAYKDNWITSLLAYGGGYANDMSVKGGYGSGSDTTGNWFAGVASKTAYNYHLPHDLILQPTALVSYNIFGNQNYHSNFGNMSMNSGFLNGINVAPGVNLIWNKKTFSLYATAQLVFNIMGDVSGKAGNIDLNDVRMKTTYFEYGVGAMKRFKDRFTGYVQITLRNGYRTGIGFQGGLQWKIGK